MPRYSIAGFRAGEIIDTPHDRVELHRNDGAANLTAEQLAYFRAGGFTVTKAADSPPLEAVIPQGPEDAEIRDAMRRAEEQVAAASSVRNVTAAAGVVAPAKK